MADTSLDLKLNSLLEATFSMFILFTFPPYDRSKEVMEKYIMLHSGKLTHKCAFFYITKPQGRQNGI